MALEGVGSAHTLTWLAMIITTTRHKRVTRIDNSLSLFFRRVKHSGEALQTETPIYHDIASRHEASLLRRQQNGYRGDLGCSA
jgi:hypothetical protein